MNKSNDGLAKIVFELQSSEWHDHGTESLWAKPLGNDTYEIDNIPFYAYGVSDKDVVFAMMKDNELLFQNVVKNGGHSTYRIFQNEGVLAQVFDVYWKPLDKIGCGKEAGGDGFFAVDVPPETDIYQAYALLEKGEENGIWQFEEGKCGHELNH